MLNERSAEHDYVRRVDAFKWLPGAREGAARLARARIPLIVISNQRGIARGLVSWDTVRAIEERIQRELRPLGASIRAFYYCPHAAEAGCACRKPGTALLLQAAREHGLDLRSCTMVGDSESDVTAGRSAGCRTILIATAGARSAADRATENLSIAADLIISGELTTDDEPGRLQRLRT